MPIILKDFFWKQTDEIVVVQVPLKQVNHGALDVFTFENYIKVHYPPFLFEVFLFGRINDGDSKCCVVDNEVVFELQKQEKGIWETLEATLTKEEKRKLRDEILVRTQEKAKEEKEAKAIKKDERRRAAVRKQMALDTSERNHVDNMKNTIRQHATNEIEEWKVAHAAEEESESEEDKIDEIPKIVEIEERPSSNIKLNPASSKINTDKISISCTKTFRENVKRADIFADKIYEPQCVPIPREAGSINVKFTPRAFPTPARESIRAEEEEWLKKQSEARRVAGFKSEDLKPEEQNPIWLKDKGDSFFAKGNYLGAISAYSHAIKLGSTLPSLFSNRAAAHLAIGNYYKAHEDSSRALELLTPCVSLNARSRARCLVRRATALCHLDCPEQALKDLEMAEKLAPDISFSDDITKVRMLIANQPASDTED